MDDKKTDNEIIEKMIVDALREDIGSGDVTSAAIIPESEKLCGEFLIKDPGVISGLDVVRKVFKALDPDIKIETCAKNGSKVTRGQVAATINGIGRNILAGERVALNFLQRMSGIATATREYVDAVAGTKAVILDTRKTMPGLRVIDKMSVRDGGGQNHRFGLYDMFLIKDNHIAAAGSITSAVNLVKKSNNKRLLIEVEVENLDELKEALSLDVDRIMLDNMEINLMGKAVETAAGRVALEASGGVSLKTVAAIAKTGVDYISVGNLTHSVKALDISLDIINQKNNGQSIQFSQRHL